jgi:distribution and morphology protein 12
MSVDLAWDVLDDALATSLLAALNAQLANVTRPSFVGPVEITAFDFGSVPPEVEIVDLRDIYRDFLEADDEDEQQQQQIDEDLDIDEDEEDGFEWVSRRSVPVDADVNGPAYHALPPHVRYGGGGPVTDMFASMPTLRSPREHWGAPPMSSRSSTVDSFGLRPLSFTGAPHLGLSTSSFPSSLGLHSPRPTPGPSSSSSGSSLPLAAPSSPPPPAPAPLPSASPHPNLQLHLRVHWPSDARLTLTTSLLINYPSPSFLSLPIKLSVTGLVFDGELAIAYEGARRRAHVSILDELDPYGPLGNASRDRSPLNRSFSSLSSQEQGQGQTQGHDYNPTTEDASRSPSPSSDSDSESSSGSPSLSPLRPGHHHHHSHRNSQGSSKPLPIAHRLLPSITLESEIGSADRHILKNVGRVERFVQDVLRKTLEDELVFPNFHTVVLGDG